VRHVTTVMKIAGDTKMDQDKLCFGRSYDGLYSADRGDVQTADLRIGESGWKYRHPSAAYTFLRRLLSYAVFRGF
jgi:hypothetical protein